MEPDLTHIEEPQVTADLCPDCGKHLIREGVMDDPISSHDTYTCTTCGYTES